MARSGNGRRILPRADQSGGRPLPAQFTVRTTGGVTATAYEWIDATDGYPRIEKWDGSTAQYGAYVDITALGKGDCYGLTAESETVMTEWCEAPHAFEVFFSDTASEASDEQQSDARCRAEFRAFIGTDAEDSSLDLQVIRPSGDVGRLVCAVYRSGELLTGTTADSRS